MTEYNVGDKIKVVGFGGMYTTYEKIAWLMGSELYKGGRRPVKTVFEIKAKRKHLKSDDMVYLLKSEEGEFLFTNEKWGTEFVMIEKSSKEKPTKFVKVEESIFDLKEEFEKGELYVNDYEGHYAQLKSEKELACSVLGDLVYLKVAIDWRDEAAEMVKGLGIPYSCNGAGHIMGVSWDDENEFIALCHKVAELTDKPE